MTTTSSTRVNPRRSANRCRVMGLLRAKDPSRDASTKTATEPWPLLRQSGTAGDPRPQFETERAGDSVVPSLSHRPVSVASPILPNTAYESRDSLSTLHCNASQRAKENVHGKMRAASVPQFEWLPVSSSIGQSETSPDGVENNTVSSTVNGVPRKKRSL